MTSRVIPISLVGILMLLALLRAASVWDALPARMASHFGPSGHPDAWQSKLVFFVLFGVTGFGTALVLLAVPTFLRFIPSRLINIPYREYWLSPVRFDEAMRRLARYTDWFSVALAALMLATLELVLRANLEYAPLDPVLTASFVIGFLVFTVGWLVLLWRAFRPPELAQYR